MHAVPRLLRFLKYEANRLQVTIGFYVNVTKQRMYYESSPIAIAHHLDIEETVDMIFSLLLEKISSYVMMHQRVPLEACTIKRLKVIVKREWNGKLSLPLQYRVKCDGPAPGSIKESVDLALLTQSFINYHGQRFGHFPISLRVNLFSLRVCATTKELYVVPYLLRSEDWTNTPTFLIQTNVTGEFQGLQEIHNVHKFLKEDSRDHVFECRLCKSHFADRTQFALHKQISCGSGFGVWHMDGDSIELYENCMQLSRDFLHFPWVGIRI
ncbi:CG6885 [Drosophila busckii]|uniref:CG6885 n=1 Tax=Drosophila busckii TaxID=30019 RepID=A0A0M4F1X5_DROBS|nr:CG6885 [Drosophila busckii]